MVKLRKMSRRGTIQHLEHEVLHTVVNLSCDCDICEKAMLSWILGQKLISVDHFGPHVRFRLISRGDKR